MTLAFLFDIGKTFVVSGFTIVMVLYVSIAWYATRSRPSFAGMMALVLFVVSFLFAISYKLVFHAGGERAFAVQIYQLGSFIVLAIYAGAAWYFVRRPDRLIQGDIFGQIFWVVLVIAEASQVLEYAACKMAGDPYTDSELAREWGKTVSIYACSRAYGWFGPYIVPSILCLLLAWPAYRACQTWQANQPKE